MLNSQNNQHTKISVTFFNAICFEDLTLDDILRCNIRSEDLDNEMVRSCKNGKEKETQSSWNSINKTLWR